MGFSRSKLAGDPFDTLRTSVRPAALPLDLTIQREPIAVYWDLTTPKLYVIILYAAFRTADKKVTYSQRIPNTPKGAGDNV